MTVRELYDIVKEFKEDFGEFKKNDFCHLESKVDRNSWFIGIGIGLFMALQILLKFVL